MKCVFVSISIKLWKSNMIIWNKLFNFIQTSLREKCPNTEFFRVRIFPHSDWIRRDTALRIQSECGKIRAWKNLVFGHFSCSVKVILKFLIWVVLSNYRDFSIRLFRTKITTITLALDAGQRSASSNSMT